MSCMRIGEMKVGYGAWQCYKPWDQSSNFSMYWQPNFLFSFLDPSVTWVCALLLFAIWNYFAVLFSCCLSLYNVFSIFCFVKGGHQVWAFQQEVMEILFFLWLHRLPFGRCSLVILLRCAFNGACVVRSLKIVTCSFLGKEFIGSVLFGAATKLNIALPFLLSAHLLCQSILHLILWFVWW